MGIVAYHIYIPKSLYNCLVSSTPNYELLSKYFCSSKAIMMMINKCTSSPGNSSFVLVVLEYVGCWMMVQVVEGGYDQDRVHRESHVPGQDYHGELGC